jgi:hypothetical protein
MAGSCKHGNETSGSIKFNFENPKERDYLDDNIDMDLK